MDINYSPSSFFLLSFSKRAKSFFTQQKESLFFFFQNTINKTQDAHHHQPQKHSQKSLLFQAAKLYNQLNVEKMSRGLGHSAGHSTLEESFQFIFSSSSLSSSASSSPSSSSLSSSANSPFYFNKMPQIKSLGDDLFGVLLRRSPPKEIPPEPVSRAPLILELAQFFTGFLFSFLEKKLSI